MICFCACARRSSRARAGRWALGAHTVSVFAALRLRCDARAGVAPQNSLRALCALRSNSCGEHVDEARFAWLPRPCASRRHRVSPQRPAPSASLYNELIAYVGKPTASLSMRVASGLGVPLGRRVAQGLRPRAQRASSTDSSRLSERSAQSARSELRDGLQTRATQGSLRAAVTAPVKRPAQRPHALAAL